MNFLAHLYLAGKNNEIIVGNFIADAVKGKAIENYSVGVRNGIIMHRAIDSFTDQHPIIKKLVKIIRPYQGKFSPVVLDILLDHFLAINWSKYHLDTLSAFSINVYTVLDIYKLEFPEPMPFVFEKMKIENWLENYQYLDGINQSLMGMHHRVSYANEMHKGGMLIPLFFDELNASFEEFFETLVREF